MSIPFIHRTGRVRVAQAREIRARLRIGAAALVAASLTLATVPSSAGPALAMETALRLSGIGFLVLAALSVRRLRHQAGTIALGAGFAIALVIALPVAVRGAGEIPAAALGEALLVTVAAIVMPVAWRAQIALGGFAAVGLATASVAVGAGWSAIGNALALLVVTAATSFLLREAARRERRRTEWRSHRPESVPVHPVPTPDDRIANLSHDVRNPLAVAIGYVDMAADDELPEEERIRALGRAKRSLWDLTQMVENVLDGTAEEAGALVLAAEPVEVSALCEDLLGAVEILARGKPLQVNAFAEAGLKVTADRTRLARVLGNLLGNAIKYTDRGEITLRALREREHVVFEVRDTGPGIAPEKMQRIFEAYRQGHTAGRGGVGLGLAISRLLTQRMGGDLTVQSTPGVGSCFRVSIPVTPSEGRVATAAAA